MAEVIALIQMISMLVLIWSGAAASYQIMKYFSRKNRELEEREREKLTPRSLSEQEIQHLLKQSVAESLEPLVTELRSLRAPADSSAQLPTQNNDTSD